jgi:hypothetical protein|tara:strand:+ start:944 stop:1129 length:186 start_codon:yes stop_codon:yes gene_type:complete
MDIDIYTLNEYIYITMLNKDGGESYNMLSYTEAETLCDLLNSHLSDISGIAKEHQNEKTVI